MLAPKSALCIRHDTWKKIFRDIEKKNLVGLFCTSSVARQVVQHDQAVHKLSRTSLHTTSPLPVLICRVPHHYLHTHSESELLWEAPGFGFEASPVLSCPSYSTGKGLADVAVTKATSLLFPGRNNLN